MQETLDNRHKIIVILFALLINLILVLPLILMNLDHLSSDALIIFHQEPESEPEPVAMAPQEPEELIEHILSSGAMPAQNDQEIQHDMDVQPNPSLAHAMPGEQIHDETQQVPAPEAEQEPISEPDDTPRKEEQSHASAQQQIQEAPVDHTVLAAEKDLEAEIQDEIKEKVMPEPKPRPQQKQAQSFGLSLGQIAQGFVKSMQQEEGLNNPQMDAERLAAHQYATRVWNIIKNSFKADANMLHLSQSIDTMAYLVITIANNGRLIDIRLEGNRVNNAFRQIESLISTHAKKAGLFPPLPQRFNVAQKTFTFPIQIQGQEGFHSYRLSYGKT